jgi:hypothetical protein
VLVGQEILCLLRGGYPDAALSRWRSLFEFTVTAKFIDTNDQTTALNYLASFDFKALRAAREHNKYAERANLGPFTDEELAALESRANNLEKQLGRRLKKDYDWAHPALLKHFPTLIADKVSFSDIELAVQMDFWRPYFRWANQHVHAGHRPLGALLGVCESSEPVHLIGPSNSGFVDPLQLAAISLVHVATVFLFTKPNLDRIIMVDVISAIRDEIAPVAMKLESESLAAAKKAGRN